MAQKQLPPAQKKGLPINLFGKQIHSAIAEQGRT
jgi:hypothetical protein